MIRRRQRKSDALLARVLQAKIPAKYGDRAQIELHAQPTRIVLESAFLPPPPAPPALPGDVEAEAHEIPPHDGACECIDCRAARRRTELAPASGVELEEPPLRARTLDRLRYEEPR